MGRQKKLINRSEVCTLIAKGFVLRQLAIQFGCHRDTIYSRFSREIKKGRGLARRVEMKEIDRRLKEPLKSKCQGRPSPTRPLKKRSSYVPSEPLGS